MKPDDDEPTEEELREAEALRVALDRGHALPGVPEDALATAALLRHAKGGAELDPARASAILEDALARARPAERKRRPFRSFLAIAFGFAAAATAASLVFTVAAPERAPSATAALIPEPPRALLEAQLEAATARVATLESMSHETDEYRRSLYGALHQKYGR